MSGQDGVGDRPAKPQNERAEPPSVKRDPHADNELIDQMQEESLGAGAQQGTAGGNLMRTVATRDELKTADNSTPEPTQLHKGDYPDGGASPHVRDGNKTS